MQAMPGKPNAKNNTRISPPYLRVGSLQRDTTYLTRYSTNCPAHTVIGTTGRAISADVQQGEILPFFNRGQPDIFGQQVNRFVNVPGNGDGFGGGVFVLLEGDDDEGGFVVNRQVLQVESRVDPDEFYPTFLFDRVDLHEQDPRVFDKIIPRLEVDSQVARVGVAGDQGAPLFQVKRSTVFGHGDAHPAADVEGVNLRALIEEPGRARQSLFELRELGGQVAGAEVEVQLFECEMILFRQFDRFQKPVGVDAELGGLFSRVVQFGMIPSPNLGVDPDPNRPARTAFAQPPDGAQGIAVDVDAGVVLDHVQVAVGDGCAGVGDVSIGETHLPGE